MIVKTKKSFNKDIDKISDSKLAQRIKETIEFIEKANTINQVHNLKKMKGDINAYRIRIGNYRLCFFFKNDIVELTIFAHRKDIYKYFP
ncbi:MAG: hypothetical protein A2X08_17145 [Bacteroidetes bacterium GWA2_32_17]|nr:MAG: hypothetical protein A2X08_17145 [Bacteroidetes bacterium GWA2_32_17]